MGTQPSTGTRWPNRVMHSETLVLKLELLVRRDLSILTACKQASQDLNVTDYVRDKFIINGDPDDFRIIFLRTCATYDANFVSRNGPKCVQGRDGSETKKSV
ncbi:hypothetical protein LIER_02554 [Lithospermum erythrorhizon]|uniref:Uncharacterized protein n=1 Tax=Lithospermum erythrorhizon TaxID=34254 RepID=A0AAV3NPX5_LITER